MKKKIPSIAFALTTFICLAQCENNNHPAHPEYMKTILGGCNLGTPKVTRSESEDANNTVVFTLSGDTLSVFVGVNFTCCTEFETEVTVSGDSLYLHIVDVCSESDEECYCRCMCYYTFDFIFTGISAGEYYYCIDLDSPLEDDLLVIQEGILNTADLK